MKEDMLKKMMAMKEGKKLSPIEQKAKISVLENMKQAMQDMLGDKVDGLKKVTVASDDASGLKEGLAKAKEMIGGEKSEDGDEDESAESDEEKQHELEDPSYEMHEDGDDPSPADASESEADLDKKIQELLKKKESLKKS